jgi:hypothetical protein
MAQSVGLVLPQILKSHGKCKKIDPSTEELLAKSLPANTQVA